MRRIKNKKHKYRRKREETNKQTHIRMRRRKKKERDTKETNKQMRKDRDRSRQKRIAKARAIKEGGGRAGGLPGGRLPHVGGGGRAGPRRTLSRNLLVKETRDPTALSAVFSFLALSCFLFFPTLSYVFLRFLTFSFIFLSSFVFLPFPVF